MSLTLPEQPILDERLTPWTVAVILLTAADLVDLEGGLYVGDWWEPTKGAPFTWTPGHRLCAVGALAVASGYRTDWQLLGPFTALYCPPANPGDDEPEHADPHPALRAVMTWLDASSVEDLFSWSDAAAKDDEPERVTETFRAIASGLPGGTS